MPNDQTNRALTDPHGWQTIETAPEQTHVLSWGFHSHDEELGQSLAIGLLDNGLWWETTLDEVFHKPTYWMPLPQPPPGAAREGE